MAQNEKLFDFSYIRNGPLLILWLSGELDREPDRKLEACWQEAQDGSEIKFVFLDLGKMTRMGADAIPAFAKFQKQIRDDDNEIRLCAVPDALKDRLLKQGVLRPNEVMPSLKIALTTLGNNRRMPPLAPEVAEEEPKS